MMGMSRPGGTPVLVRGDMPPLHLDPYIPRLSPVHRLDARVKLVLTLAYIVALTSLPIHAPLTWPLAFLALVWLVVWAARLPLGHVLKRSLLALPFTLAAAALLFTVPGQPLTTLSLGPVTLTVNQEGLLRFVTVVLKAWLAVQMTVVLSATTRFTELLQALRSLGVPQVLVSIVGFMYRYLFVLVDEVGRMIVARESRSARPDGRPGGSVAWRAGVTGRMAGSLFLRSYERSERIYAAMLARGFDGEVRSWQTYHLDRGDIALGVLALIVLATVVLSHVVL